MTGIFPAVPQDGSAPQQPALGHRAVATAPRAMKGKVLELLNVATMFLLVLGTATAHAASFNIPNGDIAALKSAINAANSNGTDDTIELAASGTYTLTDIDHGIDGLPFLGADGGRSLTINGNNATIQRSAADGTPMFRILEIGDGANVTISALTISNGLTEGAGILIGTGTLTLNNCVLTNNLAVDDTGGGILNNGHLVVTGSSFSGNLGDGGAIFNSADATVSDSIFTDNFGYDGAAIYNQGYLRDTTLTVRNSTFIGNSGNGAIYNYSNNCNVSVDIDNSTFSANSDSAITSEADSFSTTTTTINNCTFSGNSTSAGAGGAIYNGDGGDFDSFANLQVSNSTFSGNTAKFGSAIYNNSSKQGGTTRIANTIFNGGTSGGTLDGRQIISLGHNLSSDSAGGFLNATGDQINTDPMLDPSGLQDHAGPTKTIALLPDSPAINVGDPNAPARDQCYHLRNGTPDIGAFEYGGLVAPLTAVSRKNHGTAGAFDVDLLIGGNAGIECRSGGVTNDYALVATFASAVTFTNASVTSGSGNVASTLGNGYSVVVVNLTGITNGQAIALTLYGVNDGASIRDIVIPMRVLVGDVTGNGSVNSSDVSQTKLQSGRAVTNANFREDVTANGTITASDVSSVKLQSGTSLP